MLLNALINMLNLFYFGNGVAYPLGNYIYVSRVFICILSFSDLVLLDCMLALDFFCADVCYVMNFLGAV